MNKDDKPDALMHPCQSPKKAGGKAFLLALAACECQ